MAKEKKKNKCIVIDANILIRAVLGQRVLTILENSIKSVDFFTPDLAIEEAKRYLPPILKKRGVNLKVGLGCMTKKL